MAQSPAAILVRGRGIAASCCQHLLEGQCVPAPDPTSPPKLPALLISQSTQNLLADIFRATDLFYGLPSVQKRVVAWGGEEVVTLPHSGVVVSEQAILKRLRARIVNFNNDSRIANPAWTILSAKLAEPAPVEMHFGSRMAVVNEVELTEEADAKACWVESVEAGWLFLLPTHARLASLIAVGSSAERLLERSRLAAQQVRTLKSRVAEFAAYPRILSKLCGDGWLACGSAAMSFDPLCGEGTGNAARQAILACAAVQAILGQESAKEVLEEYSLRLLLGFLRHLEKCREFYSARAGNEFWSSELELIEQGIDWTRSRLAKASIPRFRLVGFALQRVSGDETSRLAEGLSSEG